jgi:VanZ family protein
VSGRNFADVAPLVGYCALVFAVSALHSPPAPEYPFQWGDKISHALAYAAMAFLAVRATRVIGVDRALARRLVAAYVFCIAYGASDELHQYFVPGRDCDVFDWLADATGSGLVMLLVPRLARWRVVRSFLGISSSSSATGSA